MGKLFKQEVENMTFETLVGDKNYEFPNIEIASSTIYQSGLAVTWDYSSAAIALHNSDAVTRGEGNMAYAKYRTAITLQEDSIAIAENEFADAISTDSCSKALTRGRNSNAIALGFGSEAEAADSGGIVAALGPQCRAAGQIGTWLILVDYNWDPVEEEYLDPRIKEVKAVKVDGEKILPGVFYKLRNGEILPYYSREDDYDEDEALYEEDLKTGNKLFDKAFEVNENFAEGAEAMNTYYSSLREQLSSTPSTPCTDEEFNDEIEAMRQVAYDLASIPPKKDDTLRKRDRL